MPDGPWTKFKPQQTKQGPWQKYAPPAQNVADPFRVQEAPDPNQIPARTTMRASPSYPARVLNAGITGQFPYVHPLDAYAEAVQPLEGIKATLPGTGVSFGDAAKRSVDLAGIAGTEIGFLGIPEVGAPEAVGERAATPMFDYAAKTLRKPATPLQAQMGEAGTIRSGLIRNTPLSDMLVPKGSPGSITRPGPYMRMPLRVKAPIPSLADTAEATPKFEPFKPSPRVAAQMKYGGPSYDPLSEASGHGGIASTSGITPKPIGAAAGTIGSAEKPFEPLIWESPEEAAARDFRMKNLERQASSAGKFHAAQGATWKRLNLQQRIGKKMD